MSPTVQRDFHLILQRCCRIASSEKRPRLAGCVFVCVERLNRRKTSFLSRLFLLNIKLHSRGVQSTVETAPNEATSIHLCWKQSLINPVYLRFQSLFLRYCVLWTWHGAKPRTASPTFYYLDLHLSTSIYFNLYFCDIEYSGHG